VAVDVRAFFRDKKVWAAAAAGGGLGLYVYLKRKQQMGAGGVDVTTGQPITPGVADSSAVDAYNNLQGELENLQGQITALYGGAPLPTAQQAVAPKPSPTPAKHYVMAKSGHPVDYAYLAGLGLIRKSGSRWVSTGKRVQGYYAGSAGHPIDYAWLQGMHVVRSA
jgi:hypothetical protein